MRDKRAKKLRVHGRLYTVIGIVIMFAMGFITGAVVFDGPPPPTYGTDN